MSPGQDEEMELDPQPRYQEAKVVPSDQPERQVQVEADDYQEGQDQQEEQPHQHQEKQQEEQRHQQEHQQQEQPRQQEQHQQEEQHHQQEQQQQEEHQQEQQQQEEQEEQPQQQQEHQQQEHQLEEHLQQEHQQEEHQQEEHQQEEHQQEEHQQEEHQQEEHQQEEHQQEEHLREEENQQEEQHLHKQHQQEDRVNVEAQAESTEAALDPCKVVEEQEQERPGAEAPAHVSVDDDLMEFESLSEQEKEEWLRADSTVEDRHEAFCRGAFCLKHNALDSAMYWLNQALEGADVPDLTSVAPSPSESDAKPPTQLATDADQRQEGHIMKEEQEEEEEMRVRDEEEQDKMADTAAEPEDEAEAEKVVAEASGYPDAEPGDVEMSDVDSDEAMIAAATEALRTVDAHATAAKVAQEEAVAAEAPTTVAPGVPNLVPEPVVRSDPELSKTLMFRARALQLQGKHIEAVRDFTSSLRLAPDSDATRKCGAYVLRAKSFRESGRPDLALRDFALAVQLDPSQLTVYIGRSALYMSLHKHALALQDCMKALELDPKNVVAHRRSGLVFAETRRLPQAIRAFNRALALRADYESLTLRGRSYVQLGEFDKALTDYSLAISLNPDVALAYGHRSVLYAHLKRLDLAINDASSFINLSGGEQCLSAYQNRGVWWAQMGDYQRAIDDFNHVIAVQPTNSFAYMSRGTAYAQMERFADSIVDWQKVAQLHPNMVKAYFNLGKQYANSGDHEHAAHYFAHVTRLMPNSVAGYQERAKALAACGKLVEALEVWQQALEHDKHNPALFEGCAETHLALQHLDEAVQALSGAIRLNPADPLNYERRAATYFKLGKAEHGRADIITAKKLRWTMDDEKRSYDELIESGHAQERPHMQVVRAAKAASAATLAKSTQ